MTTTHPRSCRAQQLILLLGMLALLLAPDKRCPACVLAIAPDAPAVPVAAALLPRANDGGRIRTEALPLIGASAYHTAGVLGAGVKVAVIDETYAGVSARIAEGELPATLVTRRFTSDGRSTPTLLESDDAHGTACAEIIHDIAPHAQLYLIQVDNLVNTLEAVLDYLRAEGVRVVSISMSTLSPGRGDGSGRVSDSPVPLYALLDAAREDGLLLVKSAGNYAQQHYQGAFRDAAGNGWHEFGYTRAGFADESLPLALRQHTPVHITLAWDDWGDDPLHPAATCDYDLYLFDARGAEVARSAARQSGGGAPVETIAFTPRAEGRYELRVRRVAPCGHDHTLQIFAIGEGAGLTAYLTPEGSLGAPADAHSVLTVGAINASTGRPIAYSSRGPTRDGRIKPDLSSYSFVSVASPGYGPRGFGGTSAATPHVAGIAALLLSLPGPHALPVAELEARLFAAALDQGPPGPDTVWGAGIARLPSLAGGAAEELPIAAPPSMNASLDTDGDGLPDVWEQTYGTHSLVSDAQKDLDNDGLTNLEEFGHGTDPLAWDSDGDGLGDGEEVYGYFATSPINPDTDQGGVDDRTELLQGSNPLDPHDDARKAPPVFLPLTLRPYVSPPRPRPHALHAGELWLAVAGGVARWELATQRYIKYTPADGLAHGEVYAILADGAGNVWIGTQGGVSRFDGARWHTFTTAHGLPHSIVRALAPAPDGSVWAATASGVARFDGTRWQATEELLLRDLYAILVDAGGQVWVGGRAGAAVRERVGWRTLGGGLADVWVTAIAADAAGRIWFGTWGAGVAVLDPRTPGSLTWFTPADGLPDAYVSAILNDESGALWVRTRDSLSLWDDTGWTTFTADATIQRAARFAAPITVAAHRWYGTRPLEDLSAPLALVMTAEARPWFGLAQRAQTETGAWAHYQIAPGVGVARVVVDDAGRVWAAAGDTLSAFDGERWTMLTPFEGAADKRIVALVADQVRGGVWAGTDGGGVLRATASGWQRLGVPQGLPSAYIHALTVAPDGAVWFGAGGGPPGVSRWQPDTDNWTTFNRVEQVGGNRVSALAVGPQGALWVATEKHLSRFDGATWALVAPVPAPVHVVAVDVSGQVWIGSAQGLGQLTADGWRMVAPPGVEMLAVRHILIALDGDLWCATPRGVHIYTPQDGSWRSITTREGLLSDDVWAIAPDSAGRFWFATAEGVSVWTPAKR